MSAQQVPVLQETDKEMWKTILSYDTTTFTTTINNHNETITDNETCFIRIIFHLVLELVVRVLQVVWWRDSTEGEGWDQYCPDWGLQHPALQ